MSRRRGLGRLLTVSLLAAACAAPQTVPTRQGEADISDATLSADGKTVTVVILGADSPSSGASCTGTYQLKDYQIKGEVLEAEGWAQEFQQPGMGCALDALVCCEYRFDIPIDPPFSVTQVTVPNPSRSNSLDTLSKLLVRPPSVPTLAHLDGWRLSREESSFSPWPQWRQRYEPVGPGEPTMLLELDAAIGGPVAGTDPSAVKTIVTVNGSSAALNTYPETNELQLVWRAGDVSLALDATNTDFTKEQMVAIADSAVIGSP